MSKFNLDSDLYVYQAEDRDKLLGEGNFLNLSEMGVGKTPEAIAVAERLNCKKVLIACPNSVRWEWARQIKDWTGTEAGVSTRRLLTRLDPLFYSDSRYFIINYESFRLQRYREVLESYPFDLIILDEAHKLRKPTTKQTKGMFSVLGTKPEVKRLLLTGSPIVNNPADLHTLLCIVKPDTYTLSMRMGFIDKYCYYTKTRYGLHVYGTKPRAMEELKAQTAPFTVRRTKKEVLPYLPNKYFRYVELDMDKDQREIYRQMEDELYVMLDSGEPLWAPCVLAQLTRLRQLNLDPRIVGVSVEGTKTKFIDDLVSDYCTNGGKLVVFSCFEKFIRLLAYKYAPLKPAVITGLETTETRRDEVVRFQNDPDCPLVLGTIQAMGEGITLTAASTVILADRWWSPAVNNQAIDRLHRIGQKDSVQVIIPIAKKSIDGALSRILESKEKLSSAYLGEEEQTIVRETLTNRGEERKWEGLPEDEEDTEPEEKEEKEDPE